MSNYRGILPPGIRMYFDAELSMPLGPAKKREEPKKADPLAWFDVEGAKFADDKPPALDMFSPSSFKIKGAAKLASREVAPSGRPVEAAPPQPAEKRDSKLKVGQMVRLTEAVCLRAGIERDEPWAIARIKGLRAFDSDGAWASMAEIEAVEAIPTP